jgi:hypothetical protein
MKTIIYDVTGKAADSTGGFSDDYPGAINKLVNIPW